jgi:hypothetical protein
VFHDAVAGGQWQLNVAGLSSRRRLYVAAILNSFVVDYQLRQRVTNHLSFFFVDNVPVPRLSDTDFVLSQIVERAAKLICTTEEFDDLAREVGLPAAEALADSSRLRAELDGLIALVYGLTEDEFIHILTSFPLVLQEVKDAAISAYREFAPRVSTGDISGLLVQGEGPRVEFKSTARWDVREKKKNAELEKVIVKTVAGFLNSDGGTLLIGVEDGGAVVGLEQDYQTIHKKNRDGYELFLQDLLLNNVGKDLSPQLAITFHAVDGKDLCRVGVQPSPRPVFIKDGNFEHLYVRTGNSTRLLTTKEALEYCKTRWKTT